MNAYRAITTRAIAVCMLLMSVSFAHAALPSTGSGHSSSTSSGRSLRAFLDRDHVSLGDTVTLNIEGVGASSGTPDLSPLQNDFEVLGTSSSSSVQLVNGNARSSTQLGIALRPKHAGTLTIPSLMIDGSPTPPLILQVAASVPGTAQGSTNSAAFLETNVQTTTPYVGQQIVYTLRLFYATGLTRGQLDDPQADGAQLIHLDSDTRYQTQRGGQTWQVVERHYALIPQHAGNIVVRGPEFQGQMLDSNNPNGMFDSFFDDGNPVEARANDLTLSARAIPAGAGAPWLPAQSVQLKLDGLPADGKARVGEPLTLTLRIDAIGLSAQRLPEPQLPPIDGARVYPDRIQDATRQDNGALHGTRTRAFAVVPGRDGALTIPAITLNWWDVAHDRAALARIPEQVLQVNGGAASGGQSPSALASGTPQGNAAASPAPRGTDSLWRDVAIASIALWVIVLTLAWWWLSRKKHVGDASSNGVAIARRDKRELRRATLDAACRHDAAACEHALLAWARATKPGSRHLGQLRDALADPAQRDVLDVLERARWQNGDATAACDGVARAFERGFVWREWRTNGKCADDGLPPLYP